MSRTSLLQGEVAFPKRFGNWLPAIDGRQRELRSRCRRYVVREVRPSGCKQSRYYALIVARPDALRPVERNKWFGPKIYRKKHKAIEACQKDARRCEESNHA